MMRVKNIIRGPEELTLTPHCSLGKYMLERLSIHGERVAQVHAVTGETTTFSGILKKSMNTAWHLQNHGIKQGDVVGVLSANSLEFALPVLASLYLGATCAPLNPSYTPRELLHALSISKPSIIFCSDATVEKLTSITSQLKFIKKIVVIGDKVSHNHIPFSRFIGNSSREIQLANINPDTEVAAIMCSSGTTGLPKGVMLTHKNILVTIGHLKDFRCGNLKPSDIHLGLLPLFHAYAFICQISTLAIGLKSIVMPKFDEHLFLSSIQNYKITLLMLVPPLLVFLGKHPMVDQYDLSSVTTIWCGAAPLSKEVQIQVTNRLGISDIRQGYGLTETTLGSLMTPPLRNKYGSSGMLVPSLVCKVIDLKTGEALGPFQEGELCFKGPTIMKGYHGDLTSTSTTVDEDGFLHTGDIGYYDKDGYFYIVDRLKELIKYKAFQVPPAELEAVLLLHPAIKDAAVIGIPDESVGELPFAFVVKQPGQNITPDEVIEFVSCHVSPQKRLHGGVKFVTSIPKTASGKILRRELRNIMKSTLAKL